jgi:CDP-paratose 2-epimerase
VKGVAFNIGGGPENTTSLLELTRLIEELNGTKVRLKFSAWRTADQRYYVSDTRRFTMATGWRPRTGVREGVGLLHRWMAGHRVRDRQPQLANELDSSGVLSAAPASTS